MAGEVASPTAPWGVAVALAVTRPSAGGAPAAVAAAASAAAAACRRPAAAAASARVGRAPPAAPSVYAAAAAGATPIPTAALPPPSPSLHAGASVPSLDMQLLMARGGGDVHGGHAAGCGDRGGGGCGGRGGAYADVHPDGVGGGGGGGGGRGRGRSAPRHGDGGGGGFGGGGGVGGGRPCSCGVDGSGGGGGGEGGAFRSAGRPVPAHPRSPPRGHPLLSHSVPGEPFCVVGGGVGYNLMNVRFNASADYAVRLGVQRPFYDEAHRPTHFLNFAPAEGEGAEELAIEADQEDVFS